VIIPNIWQVIVRYWTY